MLLPFPVRLAESHGRFFWCWGGWRYWWRKGIRSRPVLLLLFGLKSSLNPCCCTAVNIDSRTTLPCKHLDGPAASSAALTDDVNIALSWNFRNPRLQISERDVYCSRHVCASIFIRFPDIDDARIGRGSEFIDGDLLQEVVLFVID